MQEEAAGDESAYTEDRDWPEPTDDADSSVRPNQGALFAAGMFRYLFRSLIQSMFVFYSCPSFILDWSKHPGFGHSLTWV